MTDRKLMFASIGLLVGGVLSLATSSIGMQCYNDNQEYGTNRPSSKSFLLFNLVTAILIVLTAMISMYYSFKKSPAVEMTSVETSSF